MSLDGGLEPAPEPGWDALDLVFIYVIGQVLAWLFDMGVVQTAAAVNGWAPSERGETVLLYWGAPLALLLAMVVVTSIKGGLAAGLAVLEVGRGRIPWLAAAGLGVAMQAAAASLAAWQGRFWPVPSNNPLLVDPGFAHSWLRVGLLAVAVAFLAPLAEELFYRKLLFGWLRARWGFWPGALSSGLLFAMAHVSWGLLLPLTLVGVGLAILYHVSGSLVTSIVAHAAINLTALVVAVIPH